MTVEQIARENRLSVAEAKAMIARLMRDGLIVGNDIEGYVRSPIGTVTIAVLQSREGLS